MDELFTIFVSDLSVDEEMLEHYEIVQWSYNNFDHPNVIAVTPLDINRLDQLGVLSIISDLNDSMLGVGEDDWIIDREVKSAVLDNLTKNNFFDDKLVFEISKLIKCSLKLDRNIYFHF